MLSRPTIRPAEHGDLGELVRLQGQLFVEDAGVFGAHVDLDWPSREGLADLEGLLNNDDSLVLIANEAAPPQEQGSSNPGPSAVGFLVGYVSKPPPTRRPVDFAVLRSLFVDPGHRGRGVGSELCRCFVLWAQNKGCTEAQVSAYAANDGAQRFYQRHGFVAQSIQRSLSLGVERPPGSADH